MTHGGPGRFLSAARYIGSPLRCALRGLGLPYLAIRLRSRRSRHFHAGFAI